MSEIEVLATRPDGVVMVKDAAGRTLEVKKLDILDELDLIEAAGADNSANARWMQFVTMTQCVRSIDGVPKAPFPTKPELKRATIRGWVGKVGSNGVNAVITALGLDKPDDEVAEAEATGLEEAKNSAGTSVSAS